MRHGYELKLSWDDTPGHGWDWRIVGPNGPLATRGWSIDLATAMESAEIIIALHCGVAESRVGAVSRNVEVS
jgi:hypothetical protein